MTTNTAPAATVTLTATRVTWTITKGARTGERASALYPTTTKGLALVERMSEQMADAKYDLVVEGHELTLKVGDHVTVYARGGRRAGVVTELKRTRAVVEFISNQRGDVHTAAFSGDSIVSVD